MTETMELPKPATAPEMFMLAIVLELQLMRATLQQIAAQQAAIGLASLPVTTDVVALREPEAPKKRKKSEE